MRANGKVPKDDRWRQKYVEPKSVDVSELPAGWSWAMLDQLSWAANYGTSQKCEYDIGGPLVIRIPYIVEGRVAWADLKYATDSTALNAADALAAGDLLVIRTNGSKDLIGRTAKIDDPLPNQCFFASYLICFRMVGDEVVRQWISFLMESPQQRRAIEILAATSAGQYNLSLSKLARLAFPFPPYKEAAHLIELIGQQLSLTRPLSTTIASQTKHSTDGRRYSFQSLPRRAGFAGPE